MYKKFSTELHKEYDDSACTAVLKYLIEDRGLYAVRNDDIYGVDIVIFGGLRKPSSYVEVEVKKVWRADRDIFPWTDINIPVRKEKFLKLGLPTEFWVLREDLKKAIVISDKILESAPKVEVPNRYNTQGEYFFKVLIDDCNQKSLE